MKSEFTVEHEPYTLFEIAESLGIPYKRLHYCYKVLSQREATKDKVKALDGRRPLQFTAASPSQSHHTQLLGAQARSQSRRSKGDCAKRKK